MFGTLPQVENEILLTKNDGKLLDVMNEKALKSFISEAEHNRW